MLYVVFVLMLFVVCLLIKSPKNKYTYFFALMTVSLVGMIMTSITLWKYNYPDIWIFKFDYKLMLKISATSSWKHYTTQNLFNFFMIMYMLSVQLFDYDLDKTKCYKIKYCKKIIFAVFSIAYLVFFSSETALKIYIALNKADQPELIRWSVNVTNIMFICIQIFYLIYPALKLLIMMKTEELWPKRRKMLTFSIYILTLSTFVICYFVLGPLRNNYSDFSSNTLLGIRDFFRINVYHYIILDVLMCIFIVCILYAIFRTQILFTFTTLRRRVFQSRWKLDNDTREIFHMLKNVMFSIESMAKQGLIDGETDEKDKQFRLISDLCEKKINDFFEITSMSKRTSYSIKAVRVYEIINEAFKKHPISKDIKIEYDYTETEDWLYVDFESMTEAIANILKNASESFENLECSEKIIKIKIYNDNDMVGIDIIDSGKGISKKELKNIFKPLYTTKSRGKNWGIGLSFVYKTILAHCGHIRINSEKNKGTCVSIILYKKEAYQVWKK